MCRKATDRAEPLGYLAYLLHLWRVRAGGKQRWRESLEDPHTGEQLGFAGISEMVCFLQQESGPAPGRPEPSRVPIPRRKEVGASDQATESSVTSRNGDYEQSTIQSDGR